jgi:ubiquinone/menaquinone biosynthesis C-methylase UbiE
MNSKNRRGHSEEQFTEERNHWFNPDFLDLMARRWDLNEYSTLLDVGAGLCHWSKLLVPYLKPQRHVTAIDNDAKWAQGNAEIVRFFDKHQASVAFQKGDAHALPFADNSFDVVTCQTVLIHLKNPNLALKEMMRVVKKGGIVICSEPSNRIQALLQDTSNQDDDIDEVLDRVKQNLAFEKFKMHQNHGNNSFGDLLTGTMNALGFRDIKSFMNDKLVSIYPPYDSEEQQAKINTYLKWGKSESELIEFENDYQKALQADNYTEFLKNYTPLSATNKVVMRLKDQTYSSGGAALLYLISGKKL